MGNNGQRDVMVDGRMSSFRCTGSTEGHENSIECDDSQRGVTHPKDNMFCTSDPWSPYNITRVHNHRNKKNVHARDMEV
jgi:hypothetical protein